MAVLILAVIVLLMGALAWRFRNEIAAFNISRQYSTQELEDQLAGNDQTIRDAVDASSDVTVRAPTDEEREALRSGSMTQEELVERLTGGASAEQSASQTPTETQSSAETTKPTETPAPSAEAAKPAETPIPAETKQPTAAQTAYQQQLSALIARVYVLREEYVNALEDMETAARADYKALPESQRTGKKLASLVSGYLAEAAALEKECDAKMDAVIAEMETLISANNGDMTLTDTVFNTYVNEKSLKKAWYMSRLQEKGLI